MPRPLVAIIDIAALQSNLAIARAAMPHAKAWAVVKANAYGHGLEFGLRGFQEADGLSLIELDAAVRLRELGWTKPLMLLEGLFEAADLAIADQHHLQVVVHNTMQLDLLRQAKLATPLDVHLKINTGMNRLGFTPERVADVYHDLHAMPSVASIAFMTHFANAEEPHAVLTTDTQLACFKQATAGLQGSVSLANSAATLLHQELSADWIRPGVMLYGASPGGGSAADFGLRPAMTLQSRLIAVQDLQAGAAVGYGSQFIAEQAMRVGVVACGYADGYPRHAPAGTPILVDGVRTHVIGRVSMDMITVDLTPVPQAGLGSTVILWGEGLPIDEVAAAAGTIGYELMCAVAPRVPKIMRD
jgi:alanine racemase